ncbi:MAG: glycoside hydrolase family 5 protein [Ardenticatenaceae bacterium]|nr:glycoside hydrolase family 5 protein [Ardenticatenaceae bacterium]HBY92846.1 hypothetical protein [Chloroflexota bacterium]
MKPWRSIIPLSLLLALTTITLQGTGQAAPVATRNLYIPVLSTAHDTGWTSPFGVEMSMVSERTGVVEAERAGFRWVRLNALVWSTVEPIRTSPATYQWNAVASVENDLRTARKYGLEPILIIRGTPGWAAVHPDWACSAIKREALSAFASFVKAAVQRYSQPPYQVRYYELYNEPDAAPDLVQKESVFGCWGDLSDNQWYGGDDYAAMLKEAYPAIKAANPEAVVILGGLLYDDPGRPASLRFLDGILANGGADNFDWMNFHYYFQGDRWDPWGPGIIGKATYIRQTLAKYGVTNKPLICTETALRTFGHEDLEPLKADFAIEANVRAMRANIPVVIWYPLLYPGFFGSGLLDPSGLAPKPAYTAYAIMSRNLASARYLRPMTAEELGGAANVEGHILTHRNGTEPLWVLWTTPVTATTAQANVRFPAAQFPKGMRITDRVGSTISVTDATDGAKDGQITVTVGPSPRFFEAVR